jgi:hypothetical protein
MGRSYRNDGLILADTIAAMGRSYEMGHDNG